MRISGSRWRSFEYTPVDAGPCAVELPSAAVGVPRRFFDCLLVRIVVEPGDCPISADAVRAVRRLCADSDASFVVLAGSPFDVAGGSRSTFASERADVLTHLADTLDVLAEFTDRLEEHGERAHAIPFGWNVACRMEMPARPWTSTLTLRASAPAPRFDGFAPPPRPRPHCPHALVSANSRTFHR
ncbi:hypothetical protein [Nocardia africana]|uniref:Uncharacterized protein n=1 Tax=Nocardia africana TaxID=134964 RepID=A0ABW6NGW6_9NOCA